MKYCAIWGDLWFPVYRVCLKYAQFLTDLIVGRAEKWTSFRND